MIQLLEGNHHTYYAPERTLNQFEDQLQGAHNNRLRKSHYIHSKLNNFSHTGTEIVTLRLVKASNE